LITTKKQNEILVAELLQKFFAEHQSHNSVGLKEENLSTFFTMFDEILDTFVDSYFRKAASEGIFKLNPIRKFSPKTVPVRLAITWEEERYVIRDLENEGYFCLEEKIGNFLYYFKRKKSQKRLATIGTEGILLPIQNTVIFLNTATNQLQDTPEVGKTFGLCNLTNFFEIYDTKDKLFLLDVDLKVKENEVFISNREQLHNQVLTKLDNYLSQLIFEEFKGRIGDEDYFIRNVSALLGMEYKSRINNFGFLSGFVPEKVFKSNSTFKNQFYPAYFKELFEVTEIEYPTLPKNYVTSGKTDIIKEFLTKKNLEKVLDGGKKFHTDRIWRNIFQVTTLSKVIEFVYENFEEDKIVEVLTEIIFPLLKQVQEDEIQSTGYLPFLKDNSVLSDSQKTNVIEFVFVELIKGLKEEKLNDDNISDFTSRLRFYFTHNLIQDLPKVVDSYYQVDGSSFKMDTGEFFPQVENGKFVPMLNLKREVTSIDTVEILMDTFDDSLHTMSYVWERILTLSEPNGVRELFRFLTQNHLKLKVPKYFTFEDGQGTMMVKVDQSLLQNNLVELIEEPTISN
jgi:hypothetical protein